MKLNKETIVASIALMVVLVFVVIWFMPSGLRQAPPIVGKTLEGRTLTLKQLHGKPVLVTFWATSCPSCIQEMPHLVELYEELHPQGLEIIGVAMAFDPPAQVRALVAQRKIPYTIVLDTESRIAREFDGVQVTPTTVLISPEGGIAYYQLGTLDMPKIRETIVGML